MALRLDLWSHRVRLAVSNRRPASGPVMGMRLVDEIVKCFAAKLNSGVGTESSAHNCKFEFVVSVEYIRA